MSDGKLRERLEKLLANWRRYVENKEEYLGIRTGYKECANELERVLKGGE